MPVSGYAFSGWSGGVCSGTASVCSVTVTKALTVTATFAAIQSSDAAPLLYSDLDSGPNTGGKDGKGAFVTVWGKNFGSVRGTSLITVGGGAVDNYVQWSDTKITFQLGANAKTGSIELKNAAGQVSNGLPFTVRAGQIYFVSPTGVGNGDFASPMSAAAAYGKMVPGSTFYYRAGVYSGTYGDKNWGQWNYTLGPDQKGTAGNNVALIGYPAEVAEFRAPGSSYGGIVLNNGLGVSDYVTIANLTVKGADVAIGSGACTTCTTPKNGASHVRIVGNMLSASYIGNTATGVVSVGADGFRIFGNEFKDTGVDPTLNNNHALYIQVGSSDVDVGWNSFHDLKMGHVIQVHTDNAFKYENVRIHDNVLSATATANSRGINVGNVSPGSWGAIYDNVLYNLGQSFSAINLAGGDWKIYNNTMYNIATPYGMLLINGAGGQTAQVYNNIFYSDGSSPYVGAVNGGSLSGVVLSNNLYFNKGAAPSGDSAAVTTNPQFVNASAGNFRLQTGSPAIDKGTGVVTSVVTRDVDGNSRTQNGSVDIGAFEVKR